MADNLIARLGAARGVIVRPVGAVRRYAGKAGAIGVDPIRAARELGVGWVLEGTIAQRGERLRVTARLLDVRNGSAAWSDSFDETFTHVFDVQDHLAPRCRGADAAPGRARARRATCRNCSRPTPIGARSCCTSRRSPLTRAVPMPGTVWPTRSAEGTSRRTRPRGRPSSGCAPRRSARSRSIRGTATGGRCSAGWPTCSTGTGRVPALGDHRRRIAQQRAG